MNIFITSPCPKKCAEYLDNKRVVKMVLESTQMLCTALNELAGEQITPYKSTHKNHPCNVWVRESLENFYWLVSHALALSNEYERRYNKRHKCLSVIRQVVNIPHTFTFKGEFPKHELTTFPNCARNKSLGIDYTGEENVFIAYRKYLNDRWDTDKQPPRWYKEEK